MTQAVVDAEYCVTHRQELLGRARSAGQLSAERAPPHARCLRHLTSHIANALTTTHPILVPY